MAACRYKASVLRPRGGRLETASAVMPPGRGRVSAGNLPGPPRAQGLQHHFSGAAPGEGRSSVRGEVPTEDKMRAASRCPQTEPCRCLVLYFNGGSVRSRVTGRVRGREERARVFTHTHTHTLTHAHTRTPSHTQPGNSLRLFPSADLEPGRHLSCTWSKGHVLLSGLPFLVLREGHWLLCL